MRAAFVLVGRTVGWLGMLLLGVAGISKAVDLEAFAAALTGWTVLPAWSHVPVAIVTPALEMALCAGWLVDRRRAWLYGAFLFVLIATVVFLLQAGRAQAPPCACFGVLDRSFRMLSTLPAVLVRNGMLLIGLVWAWTCYGRSDGPPATSRPGRRFGGAPAFSLIEVLVVVAIIGVLVSLVLVGLRHLRASRDAAWSLSNLRQHGAVFAQYAGDWRDSFPYQGIPETGEMSFAIGDRRVTVEYFHAFSYWGFALAEGYYSGDVWHPSFYSADVEIDPARGRRVSVPSYQYPCAFIAQPEYWSPQTRVFTTAQLGATTHSAVMFPASKILLINAFSAERQFRGVARRTPAISTDILLCEGSVRLIRLDEQSPGVEDGDGAIRGATHTIDGPIALHTLDGVRGRDLTR